MVLTIGKRYSGVGQVGIHKGKEIVGQLVRVSPFGVFLKRECSMVICDVNSLKKM